MIISSGKSVYTKELQQAESSFTEFANSEAFRPKTIDLSLDNWKMLPKAKRDSIKDNVYFTPAYIEGDRALKNAKYINFIVLDIEKVQPEKIPPDLPYNYIIHSTFQHTQSDPRYHLIVESDGSIPPYLYSAASNHIAELIKLPSVNPESKRCVQPIYAPKLPKDGKYFYEFSNGKRPVTLNDIPNYLTPQQAILDECNEHGFTLHDIPKHLTHKKANLSVFNGEPLSGPQPTMHLEDAASKIAESFNYLDKKEDLGLFHHLVPPIQDIDTRYCKKALSFLDSSCGYSDWSQVAAALRHQFRDNPDEGFEVFDEWSKTSPKYEGSEETYKQYMAFQPDPNDKKPITFRSVINVARSYGFEMEKLENDTQVVVDPITEEFSLDPGTLEDPAEYSIEAEFFGIPKIAPGKWYSNHYYLVNQDKVYDLDTGTLINIGAYNNNFSCYLTQSDPKDKKDFFKVQSRPKHKPIEFVLNTIKIPRIHETIYEPAKDYGSIILEDKKVFVNVYRTLKCFRDLRKDPATSGITERTIQDCHTEKLLDEHFKWLLPDPWERSILKDFIAYNFQHPGKKINYAIILQGVQGCGKSFLKELIAAALHHENVSSPLADVLRSPNTGWACNKQLVFLEELGEANKDTDPNMEKLKQLIGNPTFTFQEKYLRSKEVRNLLNIIMFSNYATPMMMRLTERRYSFLRCYAQTLKHLEELPENYFKDLFALLKFPRSICKYFLNHRISKGFAPTGTAPKTVHNKAIAKLSIGFEEQFILDTIEDGGNPWITLELISSTVLYDLLQMNEYFKRYTPQNLAKTLRAIGYHYQQRPMINMKRHRIWIRDGISDTEAALMMAKLKMLEEQSCESQPISQSTVTTIPTGGSPIESS